MRMTVNFMARIQTGMSVFTLVPMMSMFPEALFPKESGMETFSHRLRRTLRVMVIEMIFRWSIWYNWLVMMMVVVIFLRLMMMVMNCDHFRVVVVFNELWDVQPNVVTGKKIFYFY